MATLILDPLLIDDREGVNFTPANLDPLPARDNPVYGLSIVMTKIMAIHQTRIVMERFTINNYWERPRKL